MVLVRLWVIWVAHAEAYIYNKIENGKRQRKEENGTERLYLELAYSKSLLVAEMTMRAISASQRVDSS